MEFPNKLIQMLRSAQHIAILTGAGTSAESGVPTFREAQTGLWAQYEPEQLATPQAFQRNPRLVWEWYAWRRNLVTQARPNAGHHALAVIEDHVPNMTLITQNVDGLHQEAGSTAVIELHGNIMRTKCFDCSRVVNTWVETAVAPPHCPICNGNLRPDVVWFGENLPGDALQQAIHASRNCDIFFSIGTSSLVHPAASLPLEALQNGTPLVEINPQSTPLTPYATFHLAAPSGEAIPALLQTTWSK